ncbi:MAG: hypothetical protein WCQ64_03350, partial [Acidobacteriota bacterium]
MKRLVLLGVLAVWGCGSTAGSPAATSTSTSTVPVTPTPTPTPAPSPQSPTIPVPFVAGQLNVVLGRPTATSIAASILA